MSYGMSTFESIMERDDFPVDSPAGQQVAKKAALCYFRALLSQDLTALAEAVTEDVVYEMPFTEAGAIEPAINRRFAGKKEFIDFWTNAFPNFPKRHEPTDVEVSITSDGSRLFLEQRGNFTLSDGRSYRNQYVFRLTISKGKVCHIREYFNPIILAQAMRLKIAHSFMSVSP
jgi:ketosteroid isomerase-like protein